MCFACVFLNLSAMRVLSKICQYDQKHTLFSNYAPCCTSKRCTRVHCLVLKTTGNVYTRVHCLAWKQPYTFFFRGWYPTSNTSAPRVTHVGFQNVLTLTVGQRLCSIQLWMMITNFSLHFYHLNYTSKIYTLRYLVLCLLKKVIFIHDRISISIMN